MKRSLALIVFAAILPINGQEKSPQTNSHATNTRDLKQPTPSTAPSPPSSNVDTVNQQASSQQQNRSKEHPQGYFPRLFAPENLPNIGLFVVGVVGIIIALRTLKILERQTTHIKDSVQAARASSDAVVNSERAWIVAEIIPICVKFGNEWHRPVGSAWAALSGEEILAGHHLRHRLKMTNMGRTPAETLSFQIGYSRLLEGVTELPPGDAGDYVEKHDCNYALAGGAAGEIPDYVIDVDQFRRDSINEVGDSKTIEDGKWTLVFHGWVKYKHVFSGEGFEKAHFQYVYNPLTQGLKKPKRPKGEKKRQNPN